MPTIEESIDVRVPVRAAYDQWTQFEEFPRFMEDIREVRQTDDTHLHWVAEIAGERIEWDAEIVEQVPDSLISWRATAGARNDGSVAFEPLGDDAARIRVTIERDVEGAGEAAADALGLVSRRVRRDLERFKDMIETQGTASGAWRGEIRDGELAVPDDEATIGPEDYPEGTRLPSLSRLRGAEVCSPDGEKVGKVADVFLDAEASFVRYLAVRTGWLDRGQHVVPVDDVTWVDQDGDAYVMVPYTADQLRSAPTLDDDEEVTPEREEAIYAYYRRVGYWDAAREAVRARQTTPAPTPEIAEAEVLDAIARGDDPGFMRVKRWSA